MNRRQFHRALLGALGAAVLPWAEVRAGAPWQAPPRVDGARLNRTLEALSAFGRNPGGGVSRVAYSAADLQGRVYVLGLMREAGLEASVDAAGNLVGRRAGTGQGLRPIAFGSHIDSVPNGGNFDGPVGSLAAIEVIRTLEEDGIRTRHPLEVLIFQNEEGGLIGSRSIAGTLPARELDARSASGLTIREGIRAIGGDPDRLAEVARQPGDLAAFVELHIEQGGILERERIPIGVVEGIVGIGWWNVTWEGFANHAGTTPMDGRRDALLAAARFVQTVNRVVRETPGRQVGTVGRIAAEPGAPNVIPGRAVHSLEIRDLDEAKMRALFERLRGEAEQIAADSGTTVAFEELNWIVPAPAHPAVMGAVREAAEGLGLATRGMPSGAGHDAQSMARLAPTGMIFLPSVGGISHAPQELSHAEDITRAADVLLHTLLRLDATLGRG